MYQEDSFKTSQVVYAHTRSDEADMSIRCTATTVMRSITW